MLSVTRLFQRAVNPTTNHLTRRLAYGAVEKSVINRPVIDGQNDTETQFKQSLLGELRQSVLDPATDSTTEIYPNARLAFNLAAYVNRSESLQQLLNLGVDLHKLEKRKGIPQFVLKLDFERDMKQHLRFLTDIGIPVKDLGEFLTKNPMIFKENLENMEIRINYLRSKRFLPEQIIRIVHKNPFWLMISTRRIDKRLGFFQKTFQLAGDEVRLLTTKQPRIITYNLEHIRLNNFAIKEEMGFGKHELKHLLLSKPKLWMINQDKLMHRFEYVHRKMLICHAEILKTPEILQVRDHRLKQRHGFLKFLGKAQYDPKKELYISLKLLLDGTDEKFVVDVAKSNMNCYNNFLKTL
ncbi:transcription termination factor 3, mitochondrial [Topomyia yanbarensis]|uniref:transcription termination factor 3, mitochondrial n=1 Tax=Topomyia yanbarensis TaxID=2498891 RepID=UPI00273B59B6|nr:transcription termination factor 3, mitochondrial [Topomyia yanbarensis]